MDRIDVRPGQPAARRSGLSGARTPVRRITWRGAPASVATRRLGVRRDPSGRVTWTPIGRS